MHKGIILAGGTGSRLHPSTLVISKQLLSLYDKPMVYYPLSILMLSDIRDILIISTPNDLPLFQALLGDGGQWGVNLTYRVQDSPSGIAQALIIADDFLNGSPCCLVLGDNLYYGNGMDKLLCDAQLNNGATVFAYRVVNPSAYGVVEFNSDNKVVSISEKPQHPKSNFAVTGLYFYDGNATEYAKQLKPSARGELEITDLNLRYLELNMLHVVLLDRGFAWLDTGTHDSLLEAANFIQTIEHRQGLKIACLEEIAFYKGWISKQDISHIVSKMGNSSYSRYLSMLLKE
jgi:glucose-1-phosphate thymidylyltransferase